MTGQRQKPPSQKLAIYETLHSLNQSFEQVLEDLRRFEEFPFFRRQLLRTLTTITEETRAWANFEVVEVMHERELNNWTHFGHLRHVWETRHRDPDDVLLEAEQLRRRRRKALKRRSKSGGVRQGQRQ